MSEFLLAAAGFVLAMVALGLIRILRGPKRADRMMAAQLLGTGGIGALLLAAGGGLPAAVDVALTLALLAAFASIVFVKSSGARELEDPNRKRNYEARIGCFYDRRGLLGRVLFSRGHGRAIALSGHAYPASCLN